MGTVPLASFLGEEMGPYIKINKLNMERIPGSEISFTVEKGEVIGITGESGSGKTTLAMYLAGLLRPETMGQVMVAGCDPFSQLDEKKLSRICGYVYQNPLEGVVYENVSRDIIFGPENMGLDAERIKKRTRIYLKRFNLRKKTAKLYSSLSGGELQRAALCSTLILNPEIIILDEPFSHQSIKDVRKYMDYIVSSARKKDQTVFVFTKNSEVLRMTDRIFELSDGMLREIYADEMDLVTFPERQDSLSIEKYYEGRRNFEATVGLQNVSFGYGRELFIDDISFVFEGGSAYRITGKSGVGKTTLLQLLAGMLRPYDGVLNKSEETNIGYVFQYPEEGFVEDTVLDDVMFGPMSAGYSKRESRSMAVQILKFTGVKEDLWSRSPLRLSASEQRLVAIAGALALNPDVLLIDNPYSGLDAENRNKIRMIIEGLCEEGKCIITAEV